MNSYNKPNDTERSGIEKNSDEFESQSNIDARNQKSDKLPFGGRFARIVFQIIAVLSLIILIVGIVLNVIEPEYISIHPQDIFSLLTISALSGALWLALAGRHEPAVLPVTIGVLGLAAITSIFAIMKSSQNSGPTNFVPQPDINSFQNASGPDRARVFSPDASPNSISLRDMDIAAEINMPFDGTDNQQIPIDMPTDGRSVFYRLNLSEDGDFPDGRRVRIELSDVLPLRGNPNERQEEGDPYLVLYSVDNLGRGSSRLTEIERNDDSLGAFGALIDRRLTPGNSYIIAASDLVRGIGVNFELKVVDVPRAVSNLPSAGRLEIGAEPFDSTAISMNSDETRQYLLDVDGQGERLCLAALLVPVNRSGDTELSLQSSTGEILAVNDDYPQYVRRRAIQSGDATPLERSLQQGSQDPIVALASFISMELPIDMKQVVLEARSYRNLNNNITFALMASLHKRSDFGDCRDIEPNVEFARRYDAIDISVEPN